ncbi:hypothetical protein GCM10010912_47310 [Paenibacillus albidus]|uniref:DinB-like domain-containing protein n=1 Tax=Paenibacillus albidus TaxID=2041023 RepID=A0A917FR59_9BACL|nr:DinB family protein [Paenibacillus albidus]GGF97124.1 hypothetical protein GCM10010912_47310 [Paenibacillus albidus]
MSTVSCLQTLLQEVPHAFRSLSPAEAVQPRSEGKWSPVQILGHLCDSALNNISRFINVQIEPQPLRLTVYDQNEWAEAQHYGSTSPEEVLRFWLSLNESVLRIISSLKSDQLALVFLLPEGDTITLEGLIKDYLEHLEHHLGQIFPDLSFI